MRIEDSLETGPHALLGSLVGRWRGRSRLWFEPGALAGEDTVSLEVTALHGGRWIRQDYSTRIDAKEHTGTALIGFHLDARTWQVAWVDTFHTGSEIMFSDGPLEQGSPAISVLGSYGAPEGPPWGWRTTFEPAGDHLVIRHFNITPTGEEALAVQFDLEKGPRREPSAFASAHGQD